MKTLKQALTAVLNTSDLDTSLEAINVNAQVLKKWLVIAVKYATNAKLELATDFITVYYNESGITGCTATNGHVGVIVGDRRDDRDFFLLPTEIANRILKCKTEDFQIAYNSVSLYIILQDGTIFCSSQRNARYLNLIKAAAIEQHTETFSLLNKQDVTLMQRLINAQNHRVYLDATSDNIKVMSDTRYAYEIASCKLKASKNFKDSSQLFDAGYLQQVFENLTTASTFMITKNNTSSMLIDCNGAGLYLIMPMAQRKN
jgi:hypothetical protein